MKKFAVFAAVLLGLVMVSQPVLAMDWYFSNQFTVSWDPVNTDIDGDPITVGFVGYEAFLVNKSDTGKTSPISVGGVLADNDGDGVVDPQMTVTLPSKGEYFFGTKAIHYDGTVAAPGPVLSESGISWTDDADACADINGDGTGDPFGIRLFAAPRMVEGYTPVSTP